MRAIRRALLALLVPAAAAAQAPRSPAFDSAALRWDEGRFADALARFERFLTGPDADRWRDTIALLTGERYVTTAVAPHGNRVLWSPDGRYAAIEHGARWGARQGQPALFPLRADSTPRFTLLRLDGDSLVTVGEGEGWSVVFLGTTGRLAYLVGEPGDARVAVRDAAGGEAHWLSSGSLVPTALADMGDGRVLVVSAIPGDTSRAGRTDLFALRDDGRMDTIAAGPGVKVPVGAGQGGTFVYRLGPDRIVVRDGSGQLRGYPGNMPALSADGSTLAFVAHDGNVNALVVVTFSGQTPMTVVKRTAQPLILPALSPDGRRVAYSIMPREDFEVMVSDADGRNERRLTSDIQHDYPTAFLNDSVLLTRKGESRHTRSYLFDAGAGTGQRLFHNNAVRTVSMEYAWAPSPDGRRLLVIADRDGDPYTPERGVWLTDLTRTVTTADVLARVRRDLADERALAARGQQLYAPIALAVRTATAQVEEARVRRHVENLSQFGSRQIRLPGNRRAIDYIAGELRAMGYTPDVQEFEPQPGAPSANVSITIRGTTEPDLVYVVSSHLDSVEESPGADDNGAGTCALLEIARVMRDRPQAATVVLLWVTGEEEGLLGSHEWVRRSKAAGVRVMADLNNDTFGWTREGRIESTVRYSNPAFLDIEHGAALEFTSLVTHDARMFQSSDGGAFFEGYGDIVGGFGSYPILASPHYHQSSDAAETVSPRTIAEVAKATIASLMLIASSPSPVHDLAATRSATGATVTWTAAPERGVTGYRVTYGASGSATRRTLIVRTPRAVLPGAAAGTEVAVRAMTARGREGWGWARVVVE